MQILLSTRRWSSQETEKEALDLGFDGVELRLPAVAEYTPAFIDGLSAVRAIHAPTGAFNTEEYAAALELSCKVAKQVGATVVNIHPPALSRGGRQNVLAGLALLKRLSTPQNPLLCCEVLPKPQDVLPKAKEGKKDGKKEKHEQQQAFDHPRQWMLEMTNRKIAATLDTTHLASWGVKDLREYLKGLGPNLRHLHVSDYDPETRQQHLFLGEGTIDFAGFFRAVKQLPQANELYVTLEPGGRFDLNKNRERVAKSLKIIKEAIS